MNNGKNIDRTYTVDLWNRIMKSEMHSALIPPYNAINSDIFLKQNSASEKVLITFPYHAELSNIWVSCFDSRLSGGYT